MKDKEIKSIDSSRRRFVEQGTFIGSSVLAGTFAGQQAAQAAQHAILRSKRPDTQYELNKPEQTLYTVCLNCNTGCGIKAKFQDGVLVKIDGNPYNPWTMVPHLPMSVKIDEAANVDGGLCPKGQAGVQIQYDPYRIRRVLKRAGKRGENKWITIPFEQAVNEIVEGGKLFSHVPGEEDREVEGLNDIMALRDESIARQMAEDVQSIINEDDRAVKQTLVENFKQKYKDHLDVLIDPDHPDLGPKNNQFVFMWGRIKSGRKDFVSRFGDGFGTTNLHGHTTVCQGSLYFACKAISEQYIDGKFQDGKKFYWQGDIENSRYVLFVGANLFEANYGPTNRTVRLTENLAQKRTKIAVVDPRFSVLASKADTWLPIKPGEDAALAMAMIRWMIENKRYDDKSIRNANKAAAEANGETSWTNSSWLVEINNDTPGNFVRAVDAGYASQRQPNHLLVMRNGNPTPFDPNDVNNPVEGDLLSDGWITNPLTGARIRVKSSFQLLKESAEEHTFEEWCGIAGLHPDDVRDVVRELTSYGKQAVVDIHRGAAQHTNGFYNVFAWMTVNMLLGNYDWKGGSVKATTYSYDGSKGGPFNLKKMNGKITPFGISSIRHDIPYEKTTLFEGYPAKRNWYPLSSDIYQEIIPSIGEAYPYPVKALFMYMGSPVYALPAGHTNIDVLSDVNKLPLFIASDIIVGTTSMYADYIFPDLTYLERWEFQGSHPNMTNKVQPVRQPAASPIPETVKVYGEETPVCLESTLMAFSEKLDLKTFGRNALGDGIDLMHMDDLYIRAVANLANGEDPTGADAVPDADEYEREVFRKARRHLPASVYSERRWQHIAGEEYWRKVIYILNRGGRFEEHAKGYEGNRLRHRYASLLNLYQEKTSQMRYAGTGAPYRAVASYLPQQNYAGDTLESLGEGFELNLITNRTILQTKSRTIGCYWLQPMMPENSIIINKSDADRFGLKDGDTVRVTSATNPDGEWDLKNGRKKAMEGKLAATQAIRPGTVTFVLGFGHWATGAYDTTIDSNVIKGDPRRAKGIHANAAMWTDSSLRNTTCLIDPVGGSVSFYDTKVKLTKV